MERQVDMAEVSDGKRYSVQDMAKLGCNDCEGCSECCTNMGNSIVLDPYDVYQLTTGLNCTFETLLADKLDLNVYEGIILPNLKMTGPKLQCGFLDEHGRCSVHVHRPGFCRMFPLGRIYEDGGFQYFLQVNECGRNRTKVKIKKWLDLPNIASYENFVNEWHYFLKHITSQLAQYSAEEMKRINMVILNVFFMTLYEKNRDFYEQFGERMEGVKKELN
ncbi:MAG: YkgJ family cysteine cluster protein [Eubacteriales bacterium]|nr:YkgJ family cysteine cluster protein [Eubacteriales bacterium]